jgi:hypothetical protein
MDRPLGIFPPIDIGTGGKGGRKKKKAGGDSPQNGKRYSSGTNEPASGRPGSHHRTIYTLRMIATEPAKRKAIGMRTPGSII